jgi:hypothetical protein
MVELNEQQLKALDVDSEPRFIDPRTNKTYVLVQAEILERMRRRVGEDESLDMKQVAALVDQAMREDDAGDPTLAFYQQEYGRKQ